MMLRQITFLEPVGRYPVKVDCLLVFLNLQDLSGFSLKKKKKSTLIRKSKVMSNKLRFRY